MIRLIGNDIMRNGTKIGWVTNNRFFNHIGKKFGYVTADTVYDEKAKKVARLIGEFVYYPGDEKKMHLGDVIGDIESGTLSNIQRVAIRIFFGN